MNNNYINDLPEYLNLDYTTLDYSVLSNVINAEIKKNSIPTVRGFFNEENIKNYDDSLAVLGQWCPDVNTAKKERLRYKPYAEMKERHYASSTIGLPDIKGVQSAYLIAQKMNQLIMENNISDIEQMFTDISFLYFTALCKYYNVRTENFEMIIDDNATMAFYQLLTMLDLSSDDSVLTFFDTGRVMPTAITGADPYHHQDNFIPTLDKFSNNRLLKEEHNIGSFHSVLIEHYLNGEHTTDDGILNQIIYSILHVKPDDRPKVFLIPTVTRLGRKLNFLEISKKIRELSQRDSSYTPWIILDDAQGLGRIMQDEIQISELWDNIDGILQTPSKLAGGLMGAGALLINKKRLKQTTYGRNLSRLPFANRLKKYGLVSVEPERIEQFNKHATGVSHLPQIISAISALSNLRYDEDVDTFLSQCRKKIIATLELFPDMIQVLQHDADHTYINSIIGYHTTKQYAHKTDFIKTHMAKQGYTLPALVGPNNSLDIVKAYQRIALNPKTCTTESSRNRYRKEIQQLCNDLQECLEELS